MRESVYQSSLIKKLTQSFPGCFIIRNDPKQQQGIPDLLILFEDRWAALEVKRSANEERQPNQEYYVDLLNQMSFSAFVYPENEERVLYELQQAFGVRR